MKILAQGMLAACLLVGAAGSTVCMAQEQTGPTVTQDAGLAQADALKQQAAGTMTNAFPTSCVPMGTSHWNAMEKSTSKNGAFSHPMLWRVPADVVRTDTSITITPRGGSPITFQADAQDPTLLDMTYESQTYVATPDPAAASPFQAHLQQADGSDHGTLSMACSADTQTFNLSGFPTVVRTTGGTSTLQSLSLTPVAQ